MQNWLLENIFNILLSLFGGSSLLGWVYERNKRKIEEKKMTSDAMKSMQSVYDVFTKDYLFKYEALRKEVDTLKERLNSVTEQLNIEKKKYSKLKADYDRLKNSIDKIKKRE